jgi:hypothetical protein
MVFEYTVPNYCPELPPNYRITRNYPNYRITSRITPELRKECNDSRAAARQELAFVLATRYSIRRAIRIGSTPDEGRTRAGQNRSFFQHQAELSRRLRDGVFWDKALGRRATPKVSYIGRRHPGHRIARLGCLDPSFPIGVRSRPGANSEGSRWASAVTRLRILIFSEGFSPSATCGCCHCVV